MMYNVFLKMCKKYRFTFALNTYGSLSLTLHPNDSFKKIYLNEKYYKHNKLFFRAIKEMKQYRVKRGR